MIRWHDNMIFSYGVFLGIVFFSEMGVLSSLIISIFMLALMGLYDVAIEPIVARLTHRWISND